MVVRVIRALTGVAVEGADVEGGGEPRWKSPIEDNGHPPVERSTGDVNDSSVPPALDGLLPALDRTSILRRPHSVDEFVKRLAIEVFCLHPSLHQISRFAESRNLDSPDRGGPTRQVPSAPTAYFVYLPRWLTWREHKLTVEIAARSRSRRATFNRRPDSTRGDVAGAERGANLLVG